MNYFFFRGALLDIYRDETSGLFGFTCYKEVESRLKVFNGRPVHAFPELALREAKLYYILSSVNFYTQNIAIVYDLLAERVIGQSRLAIKLFGEIDENMSQQFFSVDRVKIQPALQKKSSLSIEGSRSINGEPIEFHYLEFVEIDDQVKLIIERLIRRFP
jgi:hypothetical protein